MKNKSRRIFLRNTSLATTGVMLMSPLSATKNYSGLRQAIGCGPSSIRSLTGTVSSVQSGKWSEPSTWGGSVPNAGDTPVVSSGHTVTFDVDTTIAGVNINSGGVLQFDSSKSAELISRRNIVVHGKLVMKPSSPSVVQTIRFIEINENNFVGSGHDVLESDIGLWVMGAGQLDLAGATKKAWTRTTGSVNQGASSFAVQDSNGWNVGDNIVLVPTDMPGENTADWDDRTNSLTDTFAVKFERRTITAISGNTITVNLPFNHNHSQVSTDTGKTWTPEIANLSRNVRIEGTATGRSHIFIRSTMPQSIYYIAGRHLGPRKSQGGGRPHLVQGRYGIHFHHCNDGSKGSMVEGCAVYDLGNRAYVPHTSHGITMSNNVAFNCMEASFWWDFQELSHYILWDGNLTALVSRNGIDSAPRGMEMNLGDSNVARNNVVVYGHSGDEHMQGGYVWNANSEGVWTFENNLSHSNRSGLFVWQNTAHNHTIVGQESYNDHLGVFHGAYINSYTYIDCYYYNSLVRVKATSGNSSGVRFENTVFDGGNIQPFVVEIYPSPVPSGGDHNAFRDCTFKNYRSAGVLMNTFTIPNEYPRKHVCLVKCNFSGKMVEFARESKFESKIYVQPASGQSTLISQAGTAVISSFAPYHYGTGRGLKGEYYNGTNFARHAFTRIDSMIMFQQWSFDQGASPTEVHHTITSQNYSMRWTGKVEPQFTEEHKFRLEGSGGFRLWINNVKVIDSWYDRTDAKDSVTSPGISLVAGERYDIKLEHMNMSGARACMLYWESPSIGRSVLIPQSQLYSDGVVTPPPPPAPRTPIANAGADITITLPANKALLDGSASTPASSIRSYEWTKLSGPEKGNISNKTSVTTDVTDLVEGTYVFKLQVTSTTGLVTTDEVSVKINAAKSPDQAVANAGADIAITLPVNKVLLDGSASTPAASIKSYAWSKLSGPENANIVNKDAISSEVTDLVEGIYVFRLQVTSTAGVITTDEVSVTVSSVNNLKKIGANAGEDITITLPTNKVMLDGSASSPAASIISYEWIKVSGPNHYNILHRGSAVTSFQDLVEGVYVMRLQVKSRTGSVTTDEVVVTVNSASNAQPAVAKAGPDISINLPTSTAVLDGSASSPKELIQSYEWTKVSGPDKGVIANKNSMSTNLKDLVEGTYVFKLQITDKKGAISSDEVQLVVKPQAPVADAGADISVALPTNSIVLNGSASSAPSGIKTYEWTKVSGPSSFQILNKNAISPVIKNLEKGTYVFQLQITDKNGTSAADQVIINVTTPGGKIDEQKDPPQEQIQLTVNAWPNPSSYLDPTYIEINSNSIYPIKATLYNQFGKLVESWSHVPPNSSIKWNENIKKGTYVLIVQQATARKTLQLIKF